MLAQITNKSKVEVTKVVFSSSGVSGGMRHLLHWGLCRSCNWFLDFILQLICAA